MTWFVDRCRLFLTALFFFFFFFLFLLAPSFCALSKQRYMLHMVSILTLSLSVHIPQSTYVISN